MALAVVTAAAQVDPTNVAMVILAGIGQLVTLLVLFRSGRAREIQRAVAGENHKTTETLAVSDLAKAVGRITDTLDAMERWTRDHERSDDKFQSRTEERLDQQARTNAEYDRRIENTQKQLANLATGIAPAEATPLPATRHHP